MPSSSIQSKTKHLAFGIILLLILSLLSFSISTYYKTKEVHSLGEANFQESLTDHFYSKSEKLNLLTIAYILSRDDVFKQDYMDVISKFQDVFLNFKNLRLGDSEVEANLFNKLLQLSNEMRTLELEVFFKLENKESTQNYTSSIKNKLEEMRKTYLEFQIEFDKNNHSQHKRYHAISTLGFYTSAGITFLLISLIIYNIYFYVINSVINPLLQLSAEVKQLKLGKSNTLSFQDTGNELGELSISIFQLYNDFKKEEKLKSIQEDLLEQAQAEVLDQLKFVSVLIDIIPYPIFYKGPDTRFIGFNKAYEEIFKVKRKDLIGKRVLDLEYLPMEDRILYQKEDEETIKNTSELQKEMPIPFADGKVHTTLYWIKGFKRTDGTPGGLIGTFIDISHQKEIEKLYSEVQIEKEKSDKLLLNILPKKVADELKENGVVTPVYYDDVSILFTDFKGFTQIAQKMSPQELIMELDSCFSQFDRIAERYNMEKLKTIGDSYMCASGLYGNVKSHALYTALAGLEIRNLMNQVKSIKESLGFPYWELRIGIHSGPVMAGVVGVKKFAYDVWGDTVNTASRMESSGMPGQVNISQITYDIIKNYFEFTYRGEIEAKNKGKIKMYFVDRIKKEYCKDEEGFVPSEKLLSLL